MIACKTNEYPAATSAGFINPEVSQIPSKIPASPTLTISPSPTKTKNPNKNPNTASSPTFLSPTPISCPRKDRTNRRTAVRKRVHSTILLYLVYLPACYAEQSDRHYPVLYLFHGQTYSNQHWIDRGAATRRPFDIQRRIGSLHHGFPL